MADKWDILFESFTIKGVELKNRIVCPPMVQFRGLITPEGLAWYRRLAAGGSGLIIVEATGVPDFGSKYTAETIRPLVDVIHQYGAKAAIQLFPTRFGEDKDLTVDGLSIDEIEAIIRQYAVAAEVCRDAGFEGVEPHGAHSYLINKFFMPEQNHRSDEYGGSLENRCRFGVRIVEAIKQAVGDDLLILYRHTPTGQEYSIDDSLVMAEKLTTAGVDVLDISPGTKNEVGDLAQPFTSKFDQPVITVKGMEDPDDATEAIQQGRCDLVAVGRQLIADAKWAEKVQAGHYEDVLHCIECNEGCFGGIKRREKIVCTLWEEDEVAQYMQ